MKIKAKNVISVFVNKYLLVPQRFFLIVALIFGLPILIFRPAYDVPDFGAHLSRAYDVSEGHLIPKVLNNSKLFNSMVPASDKTYVQVGDLLPEDVANFTNTFTPAYSWAKIKISASNQFKLYSAKRDTKLVPLEYNTVAIYNPLSYLPQALGLFIGRVFNASLYTGVLIASVINFLLWLIMLRGAIKISPLGKWFIVVLGLLPMTLFIAPSISPDPLLMGLIFLFFAFLLRLMVGKKTITIRNYLPIIVLIVLISIFKETYFILALSTICLWKQFKTPKQAWIYVSSTILLSILVVLSWSLITAHLKFEIAPWSQPTLQEKFISHHPFSAVKTTVKALLFNANGFYWSFFGILGWLTMPIPLLCVILLSAALAVSAGANNKVLIKPWQKLVFAITLLANIALILGSLYVYWTAVGSSLLSGLQGRYFIPIAIFLIPVITNFRIAKISQKRSILTVQVLVVFCLLVTWYLLFKGYYPGII